MDMRSSPAETFAHNESNVESSATSSHIVAPCVKGTLCRAKMAKMPSQPKGSPPTPPVESTEEERAGGCAEWIRQASAESICSASGVVSSSASTDISPTELPWSDVDAATDTEAANPTPFEMAPPPPDWSKLRGLRSHANTTCAEPGPPVQMPSAAPEVQAVGAPRHDRALPKWDVQRFHFWRVLAAAPRSQGQIELHLDRCAGVVRAVKRVPATRTRESPSAYRAANPTETDDPWQEVKMALLFGARGPTYVDGVCPCYGAYLTDVGDVMLVYEYQPKGDLFGLCTKMPARGEERIKLSMVLMKSLLEAVCNLHERNAAHLDISMENILTDGKKLYLIDFSMGITANLYEAVGRRGKPTYQAPEMHTGVHYDATSADLFACGVVAYGLAVGSYPWKSTRPGVCKNWDYAHSHGIKAFLTRRKVFVNHGEGGTMSAARYMGAPYLALLEALLDPIPTRRCLWRQALLSFMKNGSGNLIGFEHN